MNPLMNPKGSRASGGKPKRRVHKGDRRRGRNPAIRWDGPKGRSEMNDVYAREFQEAQAVVNRTIKCPDVAAIAMVLIWLYWSRKPELAIACHIYRGIGHALAGRDLPGIGASCTDTWEQATNWGGAAMMGLADKTPGPAKLAEDKDQLPVWEEGLTDGELRAKELYEAGLNNLEVTRELGVTPARGSQMRRSMAEKWLGFFE